MNWRWGMVFAGATVGGVIALIYMGSRTKRELEQRAVSFRQQLESEEGRAIVTQQMAQMRTDLAAHAELVATRAADQHIGTYYGLTPERMQAVERLARSLGASS